MQLSLDARTFKLWRLCGTKLDTLQPDYLLDLSYCGAPTELLPCPGVVGENDNSCWKVNIH